MDAGSVVQDVLFLRYTLYGISTPAPLPDLRAGLLQHLLGVFCSRLVFHVDVVIVFDGSVGCGCGDGYWKADKGEYYHHHDALLVPAHFTGGWERQQQW